MGLAFCQSFVWFVVLERGEISSLAELIEIIFLTVLLKVNVKLDAVLELRSKTGDKKLSVSHDIVSLFVTIQGFNDLGLVNFLHAILRTAMFNQRN